MFKLRVKEIAEQRGFNKAQLARRADLGYTTVNDIWDGSRGDVRLSTLAVIAKVLGVGICDLIDDRTRGTQENVVRPGLATPQTVGAYG